ncbi:hypothetical protein K466DRAFT_565195 [Polyporus arcularius HHB13444]|uniref:Uncharacterized protein n=1 Tax=Polyporus arcularius HHB13444 TaxID=1314778 RepID=A0A5C3PFU2_9APHY|nr:hypothetical protein K466DRAFT_565195 [Polyporus arcularius HHB13444]
MFKTSGPPRISNPSTVLRLGDAIRTYFSGSGHPDDELFRLFIDAPAFSRDQDDPTLRARMFIRCLTGDFSHDDSVPDHLEIVFRHDCNTPSSPRDLGIAAPVPTPLEFHACCASCTMVIDDGMRNLLREQYPYRSFQTWFHAQLIDPGTLEALQHS